MRASSELLSISGCIEGKSFTLVSAAFFKKAY
jgi:hypothetical protein